jgi:hypothetical protein
MWDALSDERTGLSFTIAADPRQRSHSRDSRPFLTVSVSKLPYSSPPTSRRATVEVFDPPSHGIEAGSNTSTVALRIVAGDEKGSPVLIWTVLGDICCLLVF